MSLAVAVVSLFGCVEKVVFFLYLFLKCASSSKHSVTDLLRHSADSSGFIYLGFDMFTEISVSTSLEQDLIKSVLCCGK